MGNNRTFFKKVAQESQMPLRSIFSDVFRKHTKEETARVLIAGTELTTPKEEDMLAGWQNPYLFARWFLGCAAILLMAYIMSTLGYPAGNDTILLIMAILVPFTVLIFAWEMNIPRDISLVEVFKMFALGGVLSLIFTVLFSMFEAIFSVMSGIDLSEPYWAPIVEEPAKLAVIYILLKKKNRNYILDGMLIGMAVGTGFAVFETLNYILNNMRLAMVDSLIYFISENGLQAFPTDVASLSSLTYSIYTQIGYTWGLDTAIARALGSLSSHGTYAAIYGGALVIAKGRNRVQIRHIFSVETMFYFAVACVLHAANNSDIPAYLSILTNDFKYAWQILECVIMFGFFYLPLTLKGVNQVVNDAVKGNDGRITQAVNHKKAASPGTMAIQLQFVSGPISGQNVELDNNRSVTIGRDPSRCDIPLTKCDGVSGTHCCVSLSNGVVNVTDLNSTNGTYVNGHRITANHAVQAADDSIIYLGSKNCGFRIKIR